MDPFKIVIEAPKTYILGNLTYFTQLPLGTFCLIDGGCSAVDATTCVNPLAKPFFIGGAVANLGSGLCMLGAFGLGYICVPAALSVGGIGTALRRIGRHTVSTANALETKPTLTKMTTLGSKIADVLDNPVNLVG